MRQFDRHISQQRHDLATLPGYAGIRVPAPWRDLSFTTTALYYHFAVTAHGSALAFTLRLDPDVEAKARQQPSAASWVQPRIASELRKAFGRRVEFWFALENARTSFASGLHLHGELVLSPYDAVAARKALRRAGGEWLAVRQHQAHTRAEPDPGWISYSLKEEPWNRPGWRFAHLRRFNGNHHAATNGVRSEARRLYDADREQMAISKR